MAGHRASNRLSLGGVPGNPCHQNRAAMEVSRERSPRVAAKPGNKGEGPSSLSGPYSGISLVQNISFTCTHMLRMPLSVKSRFRKREGGEPATILSGI